MNWRICALVFFLVVCFSVVTEARTSLCRKAYQTLQTIERALELYELEYGRQPERLDDLVDKKILGALSKDPWGRPYVYDLDGDRVRVLSRGADGRKGTEDDVLADKLPAVCVDSRSCACW